MARVRDVVISLGLPCVGAVLLMAQAAAAQTCTPVSSTPGSLDTCFGVNGYVETDVTGTGDSRAPGRPASEDGSIVVGGTRACRARQATNSSWSATSRTARRLDLHLRCGTGIVKTPLDCRSTDSEYLTDLAIQTDGKIVVAAQMPATSKKGAETFAVLRYNVTGRWTRTFGNGGIVTFRLCHGADACARTIAVLPGPVDCRCRRERQRPGGREADDGRRL